MNKLGLCLSHGRTSKLVRELGVDYDSCVLEWKEKAEAGQCCHERPGNTVGTECPERPEMSVGSQSDKRPGNSAGPERCEGQESHTKSGSNSNSSDESSHDAQSEESEGSPSTQESQDSQQDCQPSFSQRGTLSIMIMYISSTCDHIHYFYRS